MSDALDINYIKNTISTILSKVHTHPTKLKINDRKHDRLSFACPICGDSHKDPNQKRGHLFYNNLYYKCYNENCHSTFTKLCKDFDVRIDPSKKMELIKYIDLNFQRIKKNDDDWIIGNLTKLINFDDLQEWFNCGKGPLKGFKPVEFGSTVYMYLLNRGIPKDFISELFYEGIKTNGKWSEPFVVFINKINDKVIGMQERNLRNGYERKFKIWTFKDLYENVYDDEMDLIESISYNKLSYLFNILNINFEKQITIFEGYIDSIFIPNSIGAVGINTDYSFLTNNDLDIRFLFDNDNIGKRKSAEYLKKGFNVFLWEKLINDLAKKDIDPHAFKKRFNSTIKDLNKLMQVFNIHYTELDKYFSDNVFDMLYINYEKKYIKQIQEKKIHNINWQEKISNIK
jgi:hypothetical protein